MSEHVVTDAEVRSTPRSAEEIMADMSRLGLEFEREEVEKLVAAEARRRELVGDTGSQEFYNDKVCLQTPCISLWPHSSPRCLLSQDVSPFCIRVPARVTAYPVPSNTMSCFRPKLHGNTSRSGVLQCFRLDVLTSG